MVLTTESLVADKKEDPAIAAANAGDTVELLADVKASSIIVIDKAITLNGNGNILGQLTAILNGNNA